MIHLEPIRTTTDTLEQQILSLLADYQIRKCKYCGSRNLIYESKLISNYFVNLRKHQVTENPNNYHEHPPEEILVFCQQCANLVFKTEL